MLTTHRDKSARRQAGRLGVLIVTLLVVAGIKAQAGILSETDLQRVANIKPLFQTVMSDLAQLSQRSDLPPGESDCVKSAMNELLQISNELSSYEYLMTIESKLKDQSDDSSVRSVLKFAFDKSVAILSSERPRLEQLTQQCGKLPLSGPRVRQSIQFIDAVSAILNSIQGRI